MKPSWRSREVAVLPWISRNRLVLMAGFAAACRVGQYLSDRGYWLDEISLIDNVEALTPFGFFGRLLNSQLAPPGFLVLEWLAMRCFGGSGYAFRLVPLLAGFASIFFFDRVARRCLTPRGRWLAMAMFACADDLIYFASEVKQYSTDLAASLGCVWMGLTIGSRPMTWTGGLVLMIVGSTVVWFSHPSIFVLASVGLMGLSRVVFAKDWRSSAGWVLTGLCWVASFAAVHAVAMVQLGTHHFMWAFWEFAFPPIPPRSAWEATWPIRRFALLFVNPLGFDRPIGPALSMLPALGLFIAGSSRLDRSKFAALMLPGLMAFLASCLRLYPFHGRLLVFFAPMLLPAVAAGLDRLGGGRRGRWAFGVLAAMVVGVPFVTATYHLFEPRNRYFSNRYGDNRPDGTLNPERFPLP